MHVGASCSHLAGRGMQRQSLEECVASPPQRCLRPCARVLTLRLVSGGAAAKVRRLYDIANVLCSLQLVEKVYLARKPAFQWRGAKGVPQLRALPGVPWSPAQAPCLTCVLDCVSVPVPVCCVHSCKRGRHQPLPCSSCRAGRHHHRRRHHRVPGRRRARPRRPGCRSPDPAAPPRLRVAGPRRWSAAGGVARLCAAPRPRWRRAWRP